MNNREIATALESRLQLTFPPVAVGFVDQQPAGVPRTEKLAPSACGFWRQAEQGVFYAAAEDHLNCPVGTYVMGFPIDEKGMQALQEEVGAMCANAYVEEAEVPGVPRIPQERAGIVYGALKDFPGTPDAVLVWVTPQQAMMLNEACGAINWTREPLGLFGRPGCAVIPLALKNGLAQSLGCTGMRINTDIPGEYFLMAIARDQLESLTDHLFITGEVQQKMRQYYYQRAAAARTVRV